MPLYEFGAFVLDTEQRLLRQGEARVTVPHRVFETLLLLVEAGGKVVDRETFFSRLWPDTPVEERNLTVNISMLRKALVDSASTEYIATIPRVGYRLAVPVRVIEDAAPPIAEETSVPEPDQRGPVWQPPVRIGVVLAATAILVVVAAFSLTRRSEGAAVLPKLGPLSIAVMPFRLLGVPADQDDLSVGLADAVIAQLATLPEVAVRSTSSVAGLTDGDAAEVGRRLNVDYVLEGIVQREGDVVRVTAQLVEVREAATRWTDRFEQPVSSLFRLEEAVAARVASSLAARLGLPPSAVSSH